MSLERLGFEESVAITLWAHLWILVADAQAFIYFPHLGGKMRAFNHLQESNSHFRHLIGIFSLLPTFYII